MSSTRERPSLTADMVALRWRGRLEILLIERRHAPFAGKHALPGGFVDPGESPRAAAVRELREETGVREEDLLAMLEVGVFGEPRRDPRGWTVSSAWLGLCDAETRPVAGDDAQAAAFHPLDALPELAFDHAAIVEAARGRLAGLTHGDPTPLRLLGHGFRTAQARRLYGAILGVLPPQRPFKAWLRRRRLVEKVGPARFKAVPSTRPDWLK
jgi:8-oxo-dGTP diphosphatase